MRDIRAGRVGGAATAVAALAMLTAVAPPLSAVAPASAAAVAGVIAAEAGIGDAGLSVSAAMTVGSDDPRAGDEVTVEITLTNTGPRALPVSVDEVFGDVVDDAVVQAAPRSSDPELVLLRLGHDRVAIMGELGPGERASVRYTVVVGPVDDRGDGVLRRVLVPADADVTCDDGAAAAESVPSESTVPEAAVLGACTEIALVDGPRPSAASSERVAGVTGTGAVGGTPGGGAVGGTVTADGAPADDGEGSVAGSQALVLAAAAALSLLLLCAALAVALIRRSRASRVSRRRASSRRVPAVRVPAVPVPAVPVTPVRLATVRLTTEATGAAPARRATPIDSGRRAAPAAVAAPHFDSRRERRLAERRLVERGLALPVA